MGLLCHRIRKIYFPLNCEKASVMNLFNNGLIPIVIKQKLFIALKNFVNYASKDVIVFLQILKHFRWIFSSYPSKAFAKFLKALVYTLKAFACLSKAPSPSIQSKFTVKIKSTIDFLRPFGSNMKLVNFLAFNLVCKQLNYRAKHTKLINLEMFAAQRVGALKADVHS